MGSFIKVGDINGKEKSVVLGIRGEHISLNDKKGLPAEVVFAEMLGNTTNILCRLENSKTEFNISIQDRTDLSEGDKVYVTFAANFVHLFDKESEETLYVYKGE